MLELLLSSTLGFLLCTPNTQNVSKICTNPGTSVCLTELLAYVQKLLCSLDILMTCVHSVKSDTYKKGTHPAALGNRFAILLNLASTQVIRKTWPFALRIFFLGPFFPI